MSKVELAYAKRQRDSWKKYVKMHKASIDRAELAIGASDFFSEVALFAILTAATMGLGTYLSGTRAGLWVARTAATAAEGTTSSLMSTNAAVRIFAGIGAGTTERLAAAEVGKACAAIAGRMAASATVSGVAICVRQKLRGGKIDYRFVKEELFCGMALSVVFAWIGAPGAKTEMQSSLLKKIAREMPSWRSAIGGSMPSAQAMVVGGKGARIAYRKLFAGEFAIDKIKTEMKKSGMDFDKEMAKLVGQSSKQMRLWSLQASNQTLNETRKKAQKYDYRKLVSTVAATGHAIREFFTNDAPLDYRLKTDYTEYLVACTGRDFWDGMVSFYECLDGSVIQGALKKIKSPK